MRAAMISEFGGPEVLRYQTTDDPVSPPGWITVELRAAALNWHDVLVRQGRYSSPLPHIPGADGAGVRLDTGEEVVILPSLFWGDSADAPDTKFEILGDHRPGTYAEYVSVPADCLAPKPADYSWAEAAALPLVGVTTFRALFQRAKLQPGESLLVLGAGGGVATMATMLASAIGCPVTVTSSTNDKILRAHELGAKNGVLFTSASWPEEARLHSPNGVGFDVVLDAVGDWQRSIHALRPGGRVVVLGSSLSERAEMDVRQFYFGQYSLLGTTMGSPADFSALLSHVTQHKVPPLPIAREFALKDVADAHAFLESGTSFGKTVLVC